MTDPIADFLTRIRNAVKANHKVVEAPGSKIKQEMTKILYEQGYILAYKFDKDEKGHPSIKIALKCVAMMRYLGTDLSAYQTVSLPFADSSSIADWAKSAMQAAYSLGYLTGSKTNGQLLAKPGATISRQEAMTILSRTKDFPEADLNTLSAFSDSGKIADWARTALAQMTQQKIISGSKGKLNPTGKVTRAEVAKMLYMLSTLA